MTPMGAVVNGISSRTHWQAQIFGTCGATAPLMHGIIVLNKLNDCKILLITTKYLLSFFLFSQTYSSFIMPPNIDNIVCFWFFKIRFFKKSSILVLF